MSRSVMLDANVFKPIIILEKKENLYIVTTLQRQLTK